MRWTSALTTFRSPISKSAGAGDETTGTAPISGDSSGDAVVPDTADSANKKARKHTLRFHTSKIESASARRQGARLALGGDDDVLYRERRKEKEARVQREALARKRGKGGDDLDEIEPETIRGVTSGTGVNEGDGSAEEDADEYYSLVQGTILLAIT